jgi:hypothetical protein
VRHNPSQWFSRHRKVLAIMAAVVLGSMPLVAAAATSAASTTESPSIPAAAARQLTASALSLARGDGDAKPAWIEAVSTTHEKALSVATPGDMIPGITRQTVYLVVMEGNFTLYNAPRPPGASAPSGHYLAVTFNPSTFQMMDLGLSKKAPKTSLGTLGKVSYLTRQR